MLVLCHQALSDGTVYAKEEPDGSTLYYMKTSFVRKEHARGQTLGVKEGFSGGASSDWSSGLANMMANFEAGFDLSKPMALEDYNYAPPLAYIH